MDSIQTRRTSVMNVYVSFAGARRAQPARRRVTELAQHKVQAVSASVIPAVPASRPAAQ